MATKYWLLDTSDEQNRAFLAGRSLVFHPHIGRRSEESCDFFAAHFPEYPFAVVRQTDTATEERTPDGWRHICECEP